MPAVFSRLPAALTDLLSPPHFLKQRAGRCFRAPRASALEVWTGMRGAKGGGDHRESQLPSGERTPSVETVSPSILGSQTLQDLRLTVCPLFSCSFQNPTLVLSKMMVLAINSVNWCGFLSLCLFSSPVNLQGTCKIKHPDIRITKLHGHHSNSQALQPFGDPPSLVLTFYQVCLAWRLRARPPTRQPGHCRKATARHRTDLLLLLCPGQGRGQSHYFLFFTC